MYLFRSDEQDSGSESLAVYFLTELIELETLTTDYRQTEGPSPLSKKPRCFSDDVK